MTTTNTTSIETLRTYAAAQGEIAFAHLCTTALAGEEWAIDLVQPLVDALPRVDSYTLLDMIADTDTTRPGGAIARRIEI